VDPGTQLQVAPDGSGRDTCTQAGGLVSADGEMILDGGVFHFTGGALMGDFSVRNGWIRVDASVTQPSSINVVGHENVLLDNASAVVVLRVQGGSPVGDGDAVTLKPLPFQEREACTGAVPSPQLIHTVKSDGLESPAASVKPARTYGAPYGIPSMR